MKFRVEVCEMKNAPANCFYGAFLSFAFHAKPVLASSTIIVIVLVARTHLLRILEVHLAQL